MKTNRDNLDDIELNEKFMTNKKQQLKRAIEDKYAKDKPKAKTAIEDLKLTGKPESKRIYDFFVDEPKFRSYKELFKDE